MRFFYNAITFLALAFSVNAALAQSIQNPVYKDITPAMVSAYADAQHGNSQKTREAIYTDQYDPVEYSQRTPSLAKGRDSLVFGQEIFSTENLTFAPSYNVATPKDYTLAAGDELVINVWGASEINLKPVISKEGSINISGVGPVFLSGLSVGEAEKKIKSSLGRTILSGIGSNTEVSVSLGRIRSIKINIAGEAAVPGTYTLPSLTTLFNALYMAGGVNDIGSLRNIKVFRNNKEIATLDVYDYLINGKYDTNIRLEDNDMVIIEPYGRHVVIKGKVKRERIFELKEGETLGKLIEYAGGFRGDAYNENLLIKRQTSSRYRVLTVDKEDYHNTLMSDGDQVTVGSIVDDYENILTIKGAVWRPGIYELSEEVSTLSRLIARAENLKGNEFASRGEIIRLKPDFTTEIIAFDVRKAASGEEDIMLVPKDEVYIPSIADMREEYTVTISGEVNSPGSMPYSDNMTIEDMIVLSGGFKESASLSRIEVARRIKDLSSSEYSPAAIETFTFSVSEDLRVDNSGNKFILMPFDEIYVRRSPAYKEQKNVTVTGQILYAGTYAISNDGERLSDIIERAGGFTPTAYVKGTSLKRKFTASELAKVESMLKMAASDNTGKDSLSAQSFNISDWYPVGINIEEAVNKPGGKNDLILKEGDVIFVPELNNIVKVSGAVLYSNAVAFETKSVKDYISQAGGYTDGARRRPFVVYMNGKVESTRNFLFFKRLPKIEPGCEVIVPMKQVKRSRASLAEVLGLTMSTTSTAAVVSNLLK